MIGAVILDRKRNRFINAAGSKKFTYKKNLQGAMVYDEWTAKNIVDSNLPKELKKTAEVLPVEQDEKSGKITAVYDPQKKIQLNHSSHSKNVPPPQKHSNSGGKRRQAIKLHAYQGSDCAELMSGTLDKLSEILSEVDREISDIYHFLVEHKRLPANKAVQVFYMWYEVLMRRAEIKRYIAALYDGLEPQTYRYVPRTELYGKLEDMLDVERKTKTI